MCKKGGDSDEINQTANFMSHIISSHLSPSSLQTKQQFHNMWSEETESILKITKHVCLCFKKKPYTVFQFPVLYNGGAKKASWGLLNAVSSSHWFGV